MGAGIWLGIIAILEWHRRKVRSVLLSAPSRIVSGTQFAALDCSHDVIYVTSLNMRKWMKDRLQRRKKKAPEEGSQPAPPPLQPAYFDAEQAPSTVPQSGHLESQNFESS